MDFDLTPEQSRLHDLAGNFARDAWGWGIVGGVIDNRKVNIASAVVNRRVDRRR